MSNLWAVYADTYEPEGAGDAYPVVRHIFYGRSRAEALGYHKAHRAADTFLRRCEDSGRFDSFACPTQDQVVQVARVPAPRLGRSMGNSKIVLGIALALGSLGAGVLAWRVLTQP